MARKKPLIVLLLTTRDEAETLRCNLEHHLAYGVDHVGICDNRSRDHTSEVIRSFGDRVTSIVFRDFSRRQAVRMRCLDKIATRLGRRPDWIGVSDTDEFFWAQGTSLRELLADVPAEVVAATSHQKLFVPTEDDPATGPVFCRLLYRSAGPSSPYHRSYREGKTFYRGAWLQSITSEHRCHEVPHPPWTFPVRLVHHYMIHSADQFVEKVRRLRAWRPHSQRRRSPILNPWLGLVNRRPATPFVADFKLQWWKIMQQGGEEGLRCYYERDFQVSRSQLGPALETGQLVRDPAFAEFKSVLPRSRAG